MKNIVMMLGVLLIAGAGYQPVSAEPSPMVQRHIFAPDQGLEQDANAVAPNPIDSVGSEKDLIFTGVLLTSNGKQVILSETGKNEKGIQKKKHIMKEGEAIKGMTIKEIGSNYLLLSSNENLVRIKLYTGIKSRPTPPPSPALAEAGPAANPADTVKLPVPANQPQNAAPGSPGLKMDMKSKNDSRRNVNPYGNAGNGASGAGGESPIPQPANPPTNSTPETTQNPFLDAIKRSTENAPPGGAENANPFTGR